MKTTQTPLVTNGIPFKLSEIITPGKGVNYSDVGPVCYSWHKKGKKTKEDTYSLCVFFSLKILDEVRFRSGDRVDISFTDGIATFNFSPTNPFNVYKSSGTKFMMKVSSRGIEKLMAILPHTGKPETLKVTKTSTGVITCSM
jgi:hypothetical protein